MQQKEVIEEAEAPKAARQLSLVDDPNVDFQALAREKGFAADDGRLVLDPAEARVAYLPSKFPHADRVTGRIWCRNS